MFVLIAALLVSCAATTAETETKTPVETTPALVETAVATPESSAEVAVVEEKTVPKEEPMVAEETPDSVVIDTALAVSSTDADLTQKFSYVYGHLLASSIKNQGIKINALFFNKGAADFFNYLDPVITDEEINNAFTEYQGYIDGTLTEEDLTLGSDGTTGLPISLLDRFSYGYGYLIMYNLQSQGIIVSLEDYSNGVADSVAEIPLVYSDDDINAIFTAYQEKMIADYTAAIQAMSAANLAEAEAFLETNAQLPGIITTADGLQYEVITEGAGPRPALSDTVEVDYMITFLDGSTGDSSYSRGKPSEFVVADLIPGFIEGVSLMTEGSHYRFYLHPSLAYGENGTETIAPNTLLIFDVELHEIVK